MLSEYAHLKLQTITGEEIYVHTLPALIGSKRAEKCTTAVLNEQKISVIPLTNIIDTLSFHALLFSHEGKYYIAATSPLMINSSTLNVDGQLV